MPSLSAPANLYEAGIKRSERKELAFQECQPGFACTKGFCCKTHATVCGPQQFQEENLVKSRPGEARVGSGLTECFGRRTNG